MFYFEPFGAFSIRSHSPLTTGIIKNMQRKILDLDQLKALSSSMSCKTTYTKANK